jgi:lipopolysaccharide export system permease protein
MLAVTFVLLMIFMSGRFIKYLAQAASGGISPEILFAVMAYRLPGFLELILPLGFFIGILLAYGRMYLESEMTVLHACGFSQRRLLLTTLVYSFLVALIVGGMSLFVSPWGMQKVEQLLVEQSQKTEFEMLFPGRFQSFKSGSSVTYTESISEDKKTMTNVFIADKGRGSSALDLVYAESGRQEIDVHGDRYLMLTNGARYQGLPGEPDYQVIEFKSYGMKVEQPDAEKRAVKKEAIDSFVLWDANDLESKALLQWRLSLPLLVPIVTLLAVSVSRVNPRQGRFVHLFPAMLVYVAYLGLLIVARKNLAKGSLPEWLGLWSVHLTFLCLSMVLLSKDKWQKLLQKKANGVNADV